MKTYNEVLREINALLKLSEGKLSLEITTLLWVLDYQSNNQRWLKFQEDYHTKHMGPDEPDKRVPIFLEWIGKNKNILDCGVHTGINANEYAKDNSLIGIDLPRVIEKHKGKYKFKYFSHNLEESLPFADDSFDVVIAGELIEHLLNPAMFVRGVQRVLKPNGLFIISMPYQEKKIMDPFHCNYIDDEFIKSLFGKLFNIEEKKITGKGFRKGILIKARSTKK